MWREWWRRPTSTVQVDHPRGRSMWTERVGWGRGSAPGETLAPKTLNLSSSTMSTSLWLWRDSTSMPSFRSSLWEASMWGSKGVHMWRSLDGIRRAASSWSRQGLYNSSSPWLDAVSTSLRGADPVLASWEAALVRDARFCLAGSVSGGAQTMRSLSTFAQQSRGISSSYERFRATSDSDNYSPGPQKEPLLRPKEIDGNDDLDDELLPEDDVEVASDSQPHQPTNLELELQNAPRRKQRFILQKALKIRNMETEGRPRKPGFTMKVVDVNRTCKVTKGGGILNFTALVICGNGDGVAGYGKGKSAEVSSAVDKAYARALRNLHYFERFDGHTIFHEKHSKYGQTKVYLWPALTGAGMRASHTVGGILRLAGFKNVKSKVVGSRHPHNTVKAVFQALSEIETPEEAAEREGRERVTRHA